MESAPELDPVANREPNPVAATITDERDDGVPAAGDAEAADADVEAEHDGLFVAFLVGLLLLLTLCVALTVVAANRAPG